MKLNKKLLMAALAGAIVVSGGVNTYADGEPAAPAPVVDPKTDPEENNENGYKTEAAAKAAAEEALKAEKAQGEDKKINDKYHILTNNGRFFYSLYIDNSNKTEESTEEKTEEKSNQFTEHEFVFRTKEQAEYAANYALKHEFLNPGLINNDYDVRQKTDGTWEYVLKISDKSEDKKPEEKKPEEKNPGITIDEWLLKEAKKDAIAELKKAGITSDLYFNAINKAKTIEGVNALKNEILKAHAGKEVNPSTPEVTPTPGRQPSTPVGPYAPYEPSTPGKEDKKPGEDKKPEDKKPEEKKPEEKKPEDKKPGEDKKPEDKKPGKKENTDSPNKKNKKKLPKAGSEAEILTLAAASLSSVAGAFISLKKRK